MKSNPLQHNKSDMSDRRAFSEMFFGLNACLSSNNGHTIKFSFI